MRGVEGRPGQEAHQQFKAGLPGNSSGERKESDQSKNALISPLAANLVRLMEQARQERERRGFTDFYPPFWMYDRIDIVRQDYSPKWRIHVQSEEFKRFAQREGINTDNINSRNELSDEELVERQQFFKVTQWVYGIAAYPQFTPAQKNEFRKELRRATELCIIPDHLTPTELQRQLLTDITTATNTLFNPDQEEYHVSTVLNQPEITEEEMLEDPRYGTW